MRHSAFGRILGVALSCGLSSAGACTKLVERTQVAVVIDADASLRDQIDRVAIEVRTGESEGTRAQQLAASANWHARLNQTLSAKSGWPLRFLMVRRRDEARDGYVVTATARDANDVQIGQPVSAVSAYVPGKTLELSLRFEADCVELAQPCAEMLTCRDGQCVDPFVDPRMLPAPDPGDPGVTETPPSAGAGGGGVAGQAGGEPASCDAGDSCPAASSCEKNHAGCDPLVSCASIDGRAECSACPTGFRGDGSSGCLPALSALEPLRGKLEPPFEPDQTEYVLELPLVADHAVLTPAAASGATLSVDGSAHASGTPVTSPAPGLGAERNVTIAVSAPAHATRSYTIKLRRTGKPSGYLKAGNPGASDLFGRSIALSGDTLLVGAPNEDGNARSSAAAPNDSLQDSGAAYVFVRGDSGSWEQQAYLKADPAKAGALFGYAVAIEGDRAVISAQNEDNLGAAYIFERAQGTWTQVGVVRPDGMGGSASEFGAALALSGDRLAVGAPSDDVRFDDSGAIYLFERGSGDWALTARIQSKTPETWGWLGSSVVFSGEQLFSGATGDSVEGLPCGAVHVFAAKGGNWEEIAKLTPSPVSTLSFFAEGLAVSGDSVAASAFNGQIGLTDGVVFVFVREDSGEYRQDVVLRAGNMTGGDQFGARIALSGDSLLVGAAQEASSGGGINAELGNPLENSGAAFLFNREAGVWKQVARIKAPQPAAQDRFGVSVALSGELMAIGASGDSSGGSGVDPQPTPKGAADSGAVHIIH